MLLKTVCLVLVGILAFSAIVTAQTPDSEASGPSGSETMTPVSEDFAPTAESEPIADTNSPSSETPTDESGVPTADPTPYAQGTPVVESPPTAENTPVADISPLAENTPVVVTSPQSEVTPVADEGNTPVADSTPFAAEDNSTAPVVDIDPPVVEVAPVADDNSTVPVAVNAPVVEDSTPIADNNQPVVSVPAADTPTGSNTPVVENSPVAEENNTTTPAGDTSPPVFVDSPVSNPPVVDAPVAANNVTSPVGEDNPPVVAEVPIADADNSTAPVSNTNPPVVVVTPLADNSTAPVSNTNPPVVVVTPLADNTNATTPLADSNPPVVDNTPLAEEDNSTTPVGDTNPPLVDNSPLADNSTTPVGDDNAPVVESPIADDTNTTTPVGNVPLADAPVFVDVPVAVPTSPPTTTPAPVPVSTPTSASPITTPVATPIAAPVAAPVRAPVAAPVTTPVSATPVFVQPEPVCGNKIVETGEQCDGGDNCGATCRCISPALPTMPFSSGCAQSACGNNKLDFGEQCDGGKNCTINCACAVGSVPTVPPSSECTLCGNGRVDAGEDCDGGDFCVSCKCASGFEQQSPVGFSCKPIIATQNVQVVPILECFKSSNGFITAFVGWNNLDGKTQSIPRGELNFFSPIDPNGGDVTSFAAGLHLGYPSSPIMLTWSSQTSMLTWKLSDFALVIDTTNNAAKCPEELTIKVSLSVATNGSATLSAQQQVDLTLKFAELLNVSPSRLTVIVEQSVTTKRATTSSLSFLVTIAPPTSDTSVPQQSTADAVSSFLTRLDTDSTFLKSAVEDTVPGFSVQSAQAAPQPLPTIQTAKTGVTVPVPPSVASPVDTPVDAGSRPPRASVSNSSVLTPLSAFALFVLFFLF